MPIAVEAPVAAKVAFLDAFRQAGISKSEFGRRLGKDEKEVRRLLDPKHPVNASGNWRITFDWSEGDAIDVDLEDYH